MEAPGTSDVTRNPWTAEHEDEEDSYEDEWTLERDPTACGETILHLVKKVHQTGAVQHKWVRLFCKEWTCPRCAGWKAEKAADHLRRKLEGRTAWVIVTRKERWQAIKKQIGRRGGAFVKSVEADGTVYVVTSVEVKLRSGPFAATEMSCDEACDWLRRKLEVPVERRLDWCDAWRPQRVKEGWQQVGYLTGGADAMKRIKRAIEEAEKLVYLGLGIPRHLWGRYDLPEFNRFRCGRVVYEATDTGEVVERFLEPEAWVDSGPFEVLKGGELASAQALTSGWAEELLLELVERYAGHERPVETEAAA